MNHQPDIDGAPRLRAPRSFVRREGRITKAQTRALTELLPRYAVPTAGDLSGNSIFGRSAPLYLEIGAGNGETTLCLAARHPERCYVAVEVHRPGIGHLIHTAHALDLNNIAVSTDDIHELLPRIAAATLSGAFVFFPDPWPKLRQQKRRLLQPNFLLALQRCLRREARLYLATDDAAYAAHMQALITDSPGWINLAGGIQCSPRYRERPLTRFERRGLTAGHDIFDFALALKS